MKKFKPLAVLLLLALAATPASAQTADEIIAKAVAAEGGKAREQYDTVVIKGKLSIPAQGIEGEFLSYAKRPNKSYSKITIMGAELLQATDGKICWGLNPFTGATEASEMSPEESATMLREADFDGAYYNMAAKGTKSEYIGAETIDGIQVNCVRLTFKDGHTKDYFFSADTGLLYKTKDQQSVMGMDVENEITFGNYKEVGGIKFPFKIVQNRAGTEIIVEFEEVEWNAEIDDSVFSMPIQESEEK